MNGVIVYAAIRMIRILKKSKSVSHTCKLWKTRHIHSPKLLGISTLDSGIMIVPRSSRFFPHVVMSSLR
jgi:hypothetical protein